MKPFRLALTSRAFSYYALAAVLIGTSGIYLGSQAIAADAPPAPPAPAVDVVVAQPQELRSWANFSGRLTPIESAAIKPLVSGTIQRVLFKEGQQIKKGQPLFLIDPRPHQAAVARAQAQVATAQSRATLSADELKRAQQLINAKLVAQSVYDAAVSANQVANAELQQAEASLSEAKLNLEYAHISAPISGRVGRAELTEGNVVEAGANAPVLTQIVANDKLYAEFNVDEANYIQFVRNTKNQNVMPVELTLASNADVVYQGNIYAFDNRLDTTSGTIRARAIFENADGALTAGMFANVRLGSAEKTSALLVPDRAIGTNQSKKFVLVVDEKNIANYREVSLGEHHAGQRVLLSGVNPGERVIVNGLSHVRPNTAVNPTVKPAGELTNLAAN
ncbi:MAG TPA: efflux RND transporter periplasmic adaptor subunit [Cellvibrio sp.]|nr:efflux RND transporter periplasmic adaptor subunit [Cellvibrio sp.]